MRKVDLKWYAVMHDFNKNELTYTNVLGERFSEEILKRIKSKKDYFRIYDYESLKEQVRQYLMYYYWSKSEYEVLVTGLHSKMDEKDIHKIDIWYQLEPNLDRICEYIINEMQLPKRFKKDEV